METYWIPGVNNSGKFGRWAFAEFTEVYAIESDFAAKVEAEFQENDCGSHEEHSGREFCWCLIRLKRT